MDDTSQMEQLIAYGARLGRMIVSNQYDSTQGIIVKKTRIFLTQRFY